MIPKNNMTCKYQRVNNSISLTIKNIWIYNNINKNVTKYYETQLVISKHNFMIEDLFGKFVS